MTPGRLLYLCWHRPFAQWKECRLRGGWHECRLDRRGEMDMLHAAERLPRLPPWPDAPRHRLWFLTGKRFWHQTLFCAWSFRRATGRRIDLHLVDDGSLNADHLGAFEGHFESLDILSRAQALEELNHRLPPDRFPTLHAQWRSYPNIRKLTDPHLASSQWNLVLDSDMLFFRRPDALLHWLEDPRHPLHAVDVETAYGYPSAALDTLAGATVPPLVNVGITGLDGGSLDWELLEHWCRRLIETHGTHYYLEQALVAMWVAQGGQRTILPTEDYVTLPRGEEARACHAVLHHYVADSKRAYFRHNWKKILET